MLRKSWSSLIAGILMLGSVSGADAAAADRAASGIEGYEVIFAEASPRFTHQFGLVRCSGTDCCSDPCGDILAGGCGEDCCGEGCGCGEDDDKCFQIGGWTQFGYQDGPDGAFTGNGAFNNVNFGAGFPNSSEWNTFGLYQQGLYINRTADGSNGLDYGFRAEVIYGIDGNEAQSFGNNPGRYDFANGYDHGIYEWALPQLYAEVAAGDLSVKVGHFYTIVGYEVIPSYGNFFLSRQLTFYNSEPFTHTGALATYQVSDSLSVMGGWTLGWDTGFDRFNNGSNFIGGLTYSLSDTATFIYTTTVGNLGWRGDGAVNSFILSNDWSDKITSVHQFDVLSSNLPADFSTTGVANDSTGLINYLLYTVNDKMKAGIRQEWYKADGTSYNTLTYGLNLFPTEKLVIRPEVRHMWAPGANNSVPAPGHNNLYNQTVFGIDAILTY